MGGADDDVDRDIDGARDGARDGATGWPAPHPSPPLPPPREYGSPGTPGGGRAWRWLVPGAVVLGVLVIVGLVALVRAVGGDDGDGSDDGEDPAADIATDTSSSAPSGPTPSEASPAGASAATCWDGSDAQDVSECSPPGGEAGMAWVYPHLSQQRCGAPSGDGPGVVLRILCLDQLADGSRVRLGYYQWESVEDGIAFYDDQELTRSDPDGYHQWAGSDSGSVKSATLYADAPFSVTVTLPASAVPVAEDGRIFDARPPEEVRGEPVD